MTRRFRLPVAALILAASPALAADTYGINKPHSEVSFQIRHFVTKVRGRFTDFEGTIVADSAKPAASSVEFSIKAATVDTANEGRDKDLRSPNFFEVEKYPEISFKSTKVVAKGNDLFDVTGTLSMHGVSKEITLPVSYLGAAADKRRDGGVTEKAGFETQVTINRKDWGIVWNRALDNGGFMLGDDVIISISVEADKKKDAPPAAK